MKKKIKIRKKLPWISYPGSVIQQNYGEEIDHGYLLWDIKSRDEFNVEFCKLPNNRPFVTIDWKDTISDTIDYVMKYPNMSRFRIRSKFKLAYQDVKDITRKIIEIKQASEVTFKVDYTLNRNDKNEDSKLNDKSNDLFGSNLHKVDTLINLMKEYYSDVIISDDEWKEITEIIRVYTNSSEIDNTVIRGVKWSPKMMKFDNMYGYGKGNFVDFEKMTGIIGIFGNNRVGKSSIIGTLLWTMFNSTDRGKIKNYHIINTRKNYCQSTLTVSCNGNDYTIERQAVKNESKYSSDASVTSLNFFMPETKIKKKKELNGIQRTDTEKDIRQIIGTFEDFLLMSVTTQDDLSKFIKLGSTHRARILAKFLDLDIISTMYEMAKSDVQNLRSKMSVVKFCNWEEIIKQKKLKKESLESLICDIDSQIFLKKTSLDELRTKFASMTGDSYVSLSDVEKQRKRVLTIETKLSNTEKSITKSEEDLVNIKKKLNLINDTKKKYNIDEMKRSLDECKSINEKLVMLSHKFETENNTFLHQTESVKLLKQVPCGDQYLTCKFIKNSHKDKQRIEKQEEKVEQLKEKINTFKKKIQILKFDDLSLDVEKLEKVFSVEPTLIKEYEWKTKESEMLCRSVEIEKSDLREAKSLLDRLNLSCEKKSNSTSDLIKSEIDSLTNEILSLETKKMKSAIEVGQVIEDVKRLKSDNKFYDEHKKRLRLYELVVNSFSKKGIPNRIIVKSLPLINEEIEKVLQGIVDFTVELEVDDDGNDLEVYINYGDSRRIAELGSGMEKMISSIAIRVALCNVSSLPKSDIFVIDEGFGSLDESSVEASNRLLLGLKKYFKTIIVISHVDAVKDVTDGIIEIMKNEKDSFINY